MMRSSWNRRARTLGSSWIRCAGVTLCLLLGPGAQLPAQDAKPVECARHLDKVREIVRDYWSFQLFKVGSVDLDGMAAKLTPEAEQALTADACADVLDRFMASLHDGHANLTYFPGRTPRSVPLGIRMKRFKEARVRPGALKPRESLHVVQVDTTRPELKAIPLGSQVLAIDDKPVTEVLAYMEERTSASTLWGLEHWTDRFVLRGPAGTEVTLSLRTPDGTTHEARLTRLPLPADRKEREKLAEQHGDTVTLVTWKRLENEYGYIRFTSFAYTRATREFDAALDSLKDTRGLVLDMRDNGGGYVVVLQELVGRFFKKQADIVRLLIREPKSHYVMKAPEPMLADRRKWTYEQPVVLLVDAGCFSACDLFANAMDENDRALIIGSSATGGGSASPSGFAAFPEWEGVQIRASFLVGYRRDGVHIEGRGIRPDIVIEPRLEDHVAGRDVLLERALEALNKGEARPLAAR